MNENHLSYILKHSVVVVVTLRHCLIINATVLMKKVVDSGVEVEQNFFNINNFFIFCILLISQQCLFNK